jgi:calcineurin-like phosphoesterase family protein
MTTSPKIWFTADLHFSHKNILKFCPNTRKFDSVERMNVALTLFTFMEIFLLVTLRPRETYLINYLDKNF